MQVTCCEVLKSLTAGNGPWCWEYVPEPDRGWCIPNRDGYEYAADNLLFCPYCGTKLPVPEIGK